MLKLINALPVKERVALILSVVVFVSFFLPWVQVESQAVGAVAKAITGKKQASIAGISGFQVPVLANGPESRLMISIIKIFNPGITDADKKSFLIWVVPLLAAVMFLLFLKFGHNKWVNLGIGIVGCAIFLIATFKIMTTDLDKLVLNVRIGIGLWLVFFGYLGMGLLGVLDFVKPLLGKKK
ncbi:hypothetical protein ACFLZ3_05275 [Candidatus Omnitrophota bacterium]